MNRTTRQPLMRASSGCAAAMLEKISGATLPRARDSGKPLRRVLSAAFHTKAGQLCGPAVDSLRKSFL